MSNRRHLNLDWNNFLLVDDIMSSMAAFPSLRSLSLADCHMGGKLFANEVPNLPYLEVLILNWNYLNGTLPMEALAPFHHLKLLDLSFNNFVGSIVSTIKPLSSLQVVSFAYNSLIGSLYNDGFCYLKNLHELDLSHNMFDGNLPKCLSGLSSLKFFDISSNQFTGIIPPSLIVNLTSLEYFDFSYNEFEGSFLFSLFSNHTKLQFFRLEGGSQKIEVETKEPIGWIPMFQLKILVLSNCIKKKATIVTGNIGNSTLEGLRILDISENHFTGRIPSWMSNMCSAGKCELVARNNRLDGPFPCGKTSFEFLDISQNSFSGPIPSCINLEYTKHLHLGSNGFTGLVLDAFQNLTNVLTLDISQNYLSGRIPEFLGELSNLRILLLGKNNFIGSIPEKLCQLNNIPEELGMLTHILALNLSHNKLSGPIPISFSNLSQIESLDLSSNSLSGKLPSELIQLTKLEIFDLSCRLPERKAQFGTFSKESYEGNPLLCGAPLDNNCMTTPQVSDPSTKKDSEKWYDIDKASFYGSSCSTWFVFMLGFVAILYINPYWRRRWLEFVEECMYTCYYFLYDFVWYLYKLFHE
ncbi:hypothetical protein R6Q59_016375 [Mikania micrantha]